MPYTFAYPTNYELSVIDRDLQTTAALNTDPIFKLFPIVSKNTNQVEWIMRENMSGLQAVRGLDGKPSRVVAKGANLYSMLPGVYGEFETITERELTTRAPFGIPGATINVDDLVAERRDQLLGREITRVRSIIWTLLATGTFAVLDNMGTILHTDTFAIKTYTAGIGWGTVATAIPLGNFRAMQETMEQGTSAKFNEDAKAFMNRHTFNNMLGNTNTSDLGARLNIFGLVPGLGDVNKMLLDRGFPSIEIVNDGYYTDAGVWTKFLVDDKVVVVGARPNNENIGEYQMTRNANNDNFGPGSYIKVLDKKDDVPRVIEVQRGHNGGPAIFYPNGVVVMSV